MTNDNNEYNVFPEPTFIPDPKWTHDAAKRIIEMLKEKDNLKISNNEYMLRMYDIVYIIMQTLKESKNEQ